MLNIMWNQYKKTALFMQIGIAVVCISALIATHEWRQALNLFGVMQVAAILGAVWASSIKARRERFIEYRASRLPLESRR